MFDHLYCRGKKTRLEAGDVIMNESGNKFTFYRNDERLYIGDEKNHRRDDALAILYSRTDFFSSISLVTGLRILMINDEHEFVASKWILRL